MIKRLVWWVELLLLVAACSSPDAAATATREAQRVQLAPLQITPVFSGVCQQDSYLLESWLGMAQAQMVNLVRYVEDGLKRDRQQQGELVEILVGMRNHLVGVAAPDCVQTTHVLLLGSLDVGLDVLKAYSRGDFGQMNALKSTFDSQRAVLEQQLTLLGEMLQAMIDAE